MVKMRFRDFLKDGVVVDGDKFRAWAKGKSIDEIVHEFMDLPSDARVIVIVEKKRGRKSCVICRGGITERNVLAPPYMLEVAGREMHCWIAVCSAKCEEELGKGDWWKKPAK